MSSDDKNVINEAPPTASYDEEIAQLRDALQGVRSELEKAGQRYEALAKDNEALRAENRKYFYETIKTGVPDQPPAEPEPPKAPTLDELVDGFGDNILKNRR